MHVRHLSSMVSFPHTWACMGQAAAIFVIRSCLSQHLMLLRQPVNACRMRSSTLHLESSCIVLSGLARTPLPRPALPASTTA